MGSYNDVAAGQQASYAQVQQVINAWSARANIPQAVKVTDPINFAITAWNTDPGGRGLLIYGADGATALLQVDATGVKVSPDGTAAVAVGVKNSGHFTSMTIDSGGLTIAAGGETITAGDLAITAGKITMGAAASQLVPGATSFSIRDNANANDNLLVSNAGAVTVRNGLQIASGNVGIGGAPDATASLKLTNSILVPQSNGTAIFSLDGAQTGLTIASAAVGFPFGNANNFSGLLLVGDVTNSQYAVFLIGGGASILLSQTAALFSSTVNTAGKSNVYISTNAVNLQNNTAGSVEYRFIAFRLRNVQ